MYLTLKKISDTFFFLQNFPSKALFFLVSHFLGATHHFFPTNFPLTSWMDDNIRGNLEAPEAKASNCLALAAVVSACESARRFMEVRANPRERCPRDLGVTRNTWISLFGREILPTIFVKIQET